MQATLRTLKQPCNRTATNKRVNHQRLAMKSNSPTLRYNVFTLLIINNNAKLQDSKTTDERDRASGPLSVDTDKDSAVCLHILKEKKKKKKKKKKKGKRKVNTTPQQHVIYDQDDVIAMSTCPVHYYSAVRSIVLRCGSYRYFIPLFPYVLTCSTNIQRKIPAVQPRVSVGRSGLESTQSCLLSAFTYFGRAAPPPRIYINDSLSAGLKKSNTKKQI